MNKTSVGEVPVEEAGTLFSSLSIETIVLAAATVLGGYLLNKASNIAIGEYIQHGGGDVHAKKSAKRLSAYIIYPLTFVTVLGVFGVPPSALGAAVGLIGLGVSFALQDIIANFISGILIMITRPFEIGDQIEAGGEEGTIKDISTRATEIKTYDGRKVIMPNSKLYSNQVVNKTGYSNRRFSVIVGIGYDDNIKKAKEVAEDVLDKAESVEDDPSPQVLVDELGGSSVNLKLRGWTENGRSNIVTGASEVSQLIKEEYDQAGIDIPYPIRTVYMEE